MPPLAARGGRRLLPGASAGGRARLPGRRGRLRDLPPPRRPAARARARRRAREGALARADPRAARAAPAAPDRRRARPARAPAHAARDDRVELRAARRRGAAPLRPPRRLPRRLHARGGRGGRDADLDTLQSLVDKSLLRHTDERFWMLETIREYAAERLEESGEAEELRRRHAEHFLALAEEAEPNLRGRSPREWLDRLEREHDNLRAALDRLEASGESELALRLAGALWRFWYLRGHLAEGRRRLESALRSRRASDGGPRQGSQRSGRHGDRGRRLATAKASGRGGAGAPSRRSAIWGTANSDSCSATPPPRKATSTRAQQLFERERATVPRARRRALHAAGDRTTSRGRTTSSATSSAPERCTRTTSVSARAQSRRAHRGEVARLTGVIRRRRGPGRGRPLDAEGDPSHPTATSAISSGSR